MLNACRVSLLRLCAENAASCRLYQTSAIRFNEVVSKVDDVAATKDGSNSPDVPAIPAVNTHPVAKKLMDFFDLPEHWGKDDVRSGRAWRIDELRIKSNEDLHKLWYILYKERNMLMTMQEAANEETQNMASPERIDKVEESMKFIEEVVQERNRAYWELEVGDSEAVSRRKVFRKDVFGRWRWIACSEHLIPYWMNSQWRKNNAPGFGPDVLDFNRRMRERKQDQIVARIFRDAFRVRQLLKRFENIDLDHLQELYPEVDVQFIKQNLNEYCLQDRQQRFHKIFYDKQKKAKNL